MLMLSYAAKSTRKNSHFEHRTVVKTKEDLHAIRSVTSKPEISWSEARPRYQSSRCQETPEVEVTLSGDFYQM